MNTKNRAREGDSMNHDELMDPRISVAHSDSPNMSMNIAPGWYVFVDVAENEQRCYGPYRSRLSARRRGYEYLQQNAKEGA